MKRSKFSDTQILAILKQAERGATTVQSAWNQQCDFLQLAQ